MPPGRAELGRLHVESNSEQLMSLHVLQLHMLHAGNKNLGRAWKRGWVQARGAVQAGIARTATCTTCGVQQ